jgi:N-methylhydantoinase A
VNKAVSVGQRLGCRSVLVPETGATLSAVGALMSDLYGEFTMVRYMSSAGFDAVAAADVIAELKGQCQTFIDTYGQGAVSTSIEIAVEARYPKQVWEIEIAVPDEDLSKTEALAQLVQAFHAEHRTLFQISDDQSGIEIIAWRAYVRCKLQNEGEHQPIVVEAAEHDLRRPIYLAGKGWTEVDVRRFDEMMPGEALAGPAIVESAVTTVVIDPGATAQRSAGGGLVVQL